MERLSVDVGVQLSRHVNEYGCMNLRHATPEAVARPKVRDEAPTRLRGRWLIIARVAWVVTAMLSAGLFVARLPAQYARLLTLSRADMRNPDAVRAGLAYLG
ncbi:MAG: hypothetical protein M3380_05810, partial [Chloroflexota bacterium]|nr:hypothetical protein [Chloroflexota bacterium]